MGIASVPVATHEFHDRRTGPGGCTRPAEFDAVYVSHPIQDQTKAEIEAKADAVVEELVARLTKC